MKKPSEQYFGKYSGSVKTEWLDDGRQMKLLNNLVYEDPNGLKWKAPKGSIVDGASIPTIAWTLVGSPFSGKYRDASVIHDIACINKKRTWEVVHLAFYYAMRASNVSDLKAKIMYAAVHHFGPRWSNKKKIVTQISNTKPTKKSFKLPNLEETFGFELPQMDGIEKTVELTVKIPAPPKVLNKAKFDKLVHSIEKAQESGTPYSLEKIQAYK